MTGAQTQSVGHSRHSQAVIARRKLTLQCSVIDRCWRERKAQTSADSRFFPPAPGPPVQECRGPLLAPRRGRTWRRPPSADVGAESESGWSYRTRRPQRGVSSGMGYRMRRGGWRR